MSQDRDGMLKVNGDALTRFRVQAGLTIEELAEKAGVSTRTINSYQSGKKAQITTLKLVAEYLGVEFRELLAEPYTEPPPPAAAKDRRVQVQITLSIPFEEFDQSLQLAGFLTMLQSVISASQAINVIGVTNGSVIIMLEMDEPDAVKLASTFLHTKAFTPDRLASIEDWLRERERDPLNHHGSVIPKEFLQIAEIKIADAAVVREEYRGKVLKRADD